MAKSVTQERINRPEKHLRQENPFLADCVQSLQKLGPIAGKSTFTNQCVGQDFQRTGNQAVDAKFTVICFGSGAESTSLPGLALDKGRRVESYLQLKTVPAESLRGKIFVDSPGFDAAMQHKSTVLIIDHIIDRSDLVLVFFGARDVLVPRLAEARRSWRRRTLRFSGSIFALLAVVLLWLSWQGVYRDGFCLVPFARLEVQAQIAVLLIAGVLILVIHSKLRALAGADAFVQSLNDQYASPSGSSDS